MPENDTLLAFGAGGGGGSPMTYSTALQQRNLPTRRGRQARQFLANDRARRAGNRAEAAGTAPRGSTQRALRARRLAGEQARAARARPRPRRR